MPERPKDFDYQRYLASREWALLKEQVKERNSGFCEHCHAAPHQDTHHLTYERLGHEELNDLMGLCRPCHEWVSGKATRNPLRAAWAISEPLTRSLGSEATRVVHLLSALKPESEYEETWRFGTETWIVSCSHPAQSRFSKCDWCTAGYEELSEFFYTIYERRYGRG